MIQGKRQSFSLDEGLAAFLKDGVREDVKENGQLHQAWEVVAPEVVLEHTDSVKYSKKAGIKGVLVFLDDPIWVAECNMSRDSYRFLLEKRLGTSLDEIHFYLTKDSRFKATFKKRDNQGKLVRSGRAGAAGNGDENNPEGGSGETDGEGQTRPHYIDEGVKGKVLLKEKRIIKRKCSFIEDETLRESVSKAMESNLEWKKGKEMAKRR